MLGFSALMARRTAGLLRRLGALGALLGLLAGVPYGLVRYVGWPLPDQPPAWSQVATTLTSPLSDTLIGNTLVCLLWLAWAAFAWSVLAETLAAASHARLRLPQPRALAPLQPLAALLVATITSGLLAAGPHTAAHVVSAPGANSPGVARPPVAVVVTTTPVFTPSLVAVRPNGAVGAQVQLLALAQPASVMPAEAPARMVTGQITLVVDGHPYPVTVHKGDTLSGIAQEWLGDANRWPEIFALNRGRHFDTVGGTFTSPHLIYPDWVLDLPDDATPPPGAAAAKPPASAGTSDQTQHPGPGPAGPASPAPSSPATAGPSANPTPSSPATPPSATPPSTSGPSATAVPGDDGITGAVPTPGATAPRDQHLGGSSPASPEAAPESERARSARPAPPGVELPGGGWVDLGLAAAIAAAAVVVWIQRRRRYTPRPPEPQPRLDDPDLAPLPPVVTRVRRGIRQITEPDLGDDTDAPVTARAPRRPQPAPTAPVVPALQAPLAAVWPPAGLGLAGPGAEAAGRGFLVAALACGGPDDPHARTRVVIPVATLATLLGAAAVDVVDSPRLTVTAGLDEALSVLEAETLHRTRIVYSNEVADVAAVRDADPTEEPMPPILLIADAAATHERARVAAALAQGQRLDIHGVLLGPWPDGNTVHVDADGATTPADDHTGRHGPHPADVGRLAVLDPGDAADLLRTLAEAHSGQPQPPVPPVPPPLAVRPTPAMATRADDRGHDDEKATDASPVGAAEQHGEPAADCLGRDDTAETDPTGGGKDAGEDATDTSPGEAAAEPVGAGEPSETGDTETETGEPDAGPLAVEAAEAVEGDAGDDAGEGAEADRAGGAPLARVLLLGPARIDGPPCELPLRPKSLELLVYLAVNDGTSSQDQILEDLLPDAPARRAPRRLNTYVYNLRCNLKSAGGPGEYLDHPAEHYVLRRDALDVDLWRLREAIAAAKSATDPTDRVAALREAVACYTAPLAAGHDYEWIERYREAVRQQAIDAHLALAAAIADTEPAQALTVLQAAIGHDRYAEPIYRQAMTLHAKLGQVEAIRQLRRTLTRRLDEIDVEPDDETIALADRLVTELLRRPRRPHRGDGAAA